MTKKVPMYGILTALALILSFIESLIPFYFGIPGMKLGLCNVIVVTMLYLYPPSDALIVNVLRIILAGFMFGNSFSIIYSLAGGLLSYIVMFLMRRSHLFSILSTSVAGGFSHNMGQIIVAAFVVGNANLLYYAPALMIAGIITGALIGIIATEIVHRLGGIRRMHNNTFGGSDK